ncbi:MAG: LysM peptidoglycan-binding domain-containing protein [Candidatus Omnitrophota bacterium]
MRGSEPFLFAVIAFFLFSGCVMRSYEIQQDRPDQDLSTGNRGRIKGDVPRDDIKDRKTTRQVKVLELELLSFGKSRRLNDRTSPAAAANAPLEPVAQAVPAEQPSEPDAPVFEEYKVQDNDTLQKISLKFYGSINKWTAIYDANRDVLKSPDSIYPGKTLRIPAAEKTE